MRASLRIAGITICAASLAWLGVPDIAAAAPATSARAGAATTLSAAQRVGHSVGRDDSAEAQGTATIGLGGWQVQSSAATTQWTTNQGATQDGAADLRPRLRRRAAGCRSGRTTRARSAPRSRRSCRTASARTTPRWSR